MTILKRLLYIIQIPLFVLYIAIPLFWILEIPYWIITGRNLRKDWFKYNKI